VVLISRTRPIERDRHLHPRPGGLELKIGQWIPAGHCPSARDEKDYEADHQIELLNLMVEKTSYAQARPDTLDLAVLASLRELQETGEPDIVAEIGGLFLEHAPQKLSAIIDAAERKDPRGLQMAAHSLKSSSVYVGAMRLSALCKELEEMGRSGSTEGVEEKARDLTAEFMRAKAALEEAMQRP
jgi:HPt (histidine-containing phosphotransfer) domain-containing protein